MNEVGLAKTRSGAESGRFGAAQIISPTLIVAQNQSEDTDETDDTDVDEYELLLLPDPDTMNRVPLATVASA